MLTSRSKEENDERFRAIGADDWDQQDMVRVDLSDTLTKKETKEFERTSADPRIKKFLESCDVVIIQYENQVAYFELIRRKIFLVLII